MRRRSICSTAECWGCERMVDERRRGLRVRLGRNNRSCVALTQGRRGRRFTPQSAARKVSWSRNAWMIEVRQGGDAVHTPPIAQSKRSKTLISTGIRLVLKADMLVSVCYRFPEVFRTVSIGPRQVSQIGGRPPSCTASVMFIDGRNVNQLVEPKLVRSF